MRRTSLLLPVAALCLLAVHSDAHNINRRGAINVQDDTEGPVFMDSFDDFFRRGSWLNFKPKEETPAEETAAVANEEVVRSGDDGQVPDGIVPDGATVSAPIPNGGKAGMSKTPVPNQQVPNRQASGEQQAPNKQMPNSQAPNKQMPNSQAPNKQMPNSQVPNQPVQNAGGTDPSLKEVVRQERNVGQYPGAQPALQRPTYPGFLGVAQNQQQRPQSGGKQNRNPQYSRPQYNQQRPVYRPRYPQQPTYPSRAPYPRPQQYRPMPIPQRPQYSPSPNYPINPYRYMQQQQKHDHASHSHGTPSAGVPNKYVAPNKDGMEAPNKAKGY